MLQFAENICFHPFSILCYWDLSLLIECIQLHDRRKFQDILKKLENGGAIAEESTTPADESDFHKGLCKSMEGKGGRKVNEMESEASGPGVRVPSCPPQGHGRRTWGEDGGFREINVTLLMS